MIYVRISSASIRKQHCVDLLPGQCFDDQLLELLGEGQNVALLVVDPAGSIRSGATGRSSLLGALLLSRWVGIITIVERAIESNDDLAVGDDPFSFLLCAVVFFDGDGRGVCSSVDATQGPASGSIHVGRAHSG